MSSPSPSYIPYTPKRHSTQTSIASLSQVQSSSSSSSTSSPSSSTRAPPSHSRTSSTTTGGGNRTDYSPWLKSPQPNRPSLIGVVNHHQWQSNSSTSSSSASTGRSPLNPPTTQSYQPQSGGGSNSPIPPNTLPFSPSPRPPPPQSSSGSTTPHPSPTRRPSSRTTTTTTNTTSGGGGVPYLGNFQPVGVRRDRTELFFAVRRSKRKEKLGEEERLERRLDKLLELHFPTTTTTSTSSSSTGVASNFSAFNSLPNLVDSFRSSSPSSVKDLLWRPSTSTLSSSDNTNQKNKNKLKEEEQKLVQWQPDKLIKQCQICSTSFGVLTRKHHCRLCGRIVCFLPPTSPTPPSSSAITSPSSSTTKKEEENKKSEVIVRKERCSTFFTYLPHQQQQQQQYEGQEGVEDEELKEKNITSTTNKGSTTTFKKRNGLIIELAPPVEEDLQFMKSTFDELLSGSGQDNKNKLVEKKKKETLNIVNKKGVEEEKKKVRICRDCLNIVLRHQLANSPLKTPNWLKLYKVLKTLELEIEQSLIEFQELANQLQSSQSKEHNHLSTISRLPPPPSISQTSALRARLLTNLASYDTLSKRLLSLSSSSSSTSTSTSTGSNNSELERLQKALGTRSMNWLSEKLSLLRTLGTVEELSGSRTASKKKKAAVTSSEQGNEGGGGGGIKSLESLLNPEELRKVRERIGEVGTGTGPGEESTNGKLLRLGKNRQEEREDGQLGVLLEQEKLVQSYLEDANSRRQFEDAASLQASLDELRGEIQRLRAG